MNFQFLRSQIKFANKLSKKCLSTFSEAESSSFSSASSKATGNNHNNDQMKIPKIGIVFLDEGFLVLDHKSKEEKNETLKIVMATIAIFISGMVFQEALRTANEHYDERKKYIN